MKNFLYLTLFAMIFITACGDDDDNGSGAAEGDLTITLIWDQEDADLDLSLSGPNNTAIASGFSNLSGATHSGDRTSGPGEEIIDFMNVATDGSYAVSIDWFSGSGDVDYTLVIDHAGSSRSIEGAVSANNDVEIVTFSKSGRNLTF